MLTQLQTRALVIVGIIAVIAVFVVPDLWRDTDAPLRPGGRMVFGVSEVAQRSSKAYPLRIILHKRPEGFLELEIRAEHGDRLIQVDRELQPVDPTREIEFPLASGGVLEPGALWIPSKQREAGWRSAGGFVKGIVKYKDFKAIEVEGKEGGVRYYELETGLLVGFEVRMAGTEIVGSLLSLL